MSKKILIVAAMIMFVTTGFAAAQPCGKGAWHDRDWAMVHDRIGDLDLTPEQTEKVRSQFEAFQEEIAPLRTQKFQCMTELKLLWLQMEPDVEKIKAKDKEIHDLSWKMKDKLTDHRISFRKILTSEQLSKFLAQRSSGSWGPHGKDRWHRGPHGSKCGRDKD